MTEIRGSRLVPHSENRHLVPGDVGEKADGEGVIAIGLVEAHVRDLETGREIVERVARSAPPPYTIRSREHVELANGKRAAIEDADNAAELVLYHGEVGTEAGEGVVLLAYGC